MERPEPLVPRDRFVGNVEFHAMISRFAFPRRFQRRRSERTDSLRSGERSLDSSVLGRKDGYDRKSLPRQNWLYKIGSAPGSYTCLLRMQTSSPNARKPHESARRVDVPPTRTVSTDIHGAVLPIPAEISVRARLRACSRAGFKKSRGYSRFLSEEEVIGTRLKRRRLFVPASVIVPVKEEGEFRFLARTEIAAVSRNGAATRLPR